MTILGILYPTSQTMDVFKKQEGGEHSLDNLSFFCKICGKRFVSGRALGGHMRAHAPAFMDADTLNETDFRKSKRPRALYDKSMEEKNDEEGSDGSGSNLMFSLRRTPNCSWRFVDRDYSFLLGKGFGSKPSDSSINCDFCGKEFSSWKGLFDHMKCHSETHQDSGDAHLKESKKHETQKEEEERSQSDTDIEIDCPSENSGRFDMWMKGKISKKPRHAIQLNPQEQFGLDTNNEEEVVAMCLVMLGSGVNTVQNPQFQMGAEGPGSGDLRLPNNGSQLPKCIRKKPKAKQIDGDTSLYDDDEVKKARYKCITCNKVFHSHQALVGHRASHNKVKGCFSQIQEMNERLKEEITDEDLNTGSDSQLPSNFQKPAPKEMTKESCVESRDEKRMIEPAAIAGKKTLCVHECSVCHRVFASGQALGGHKRSHWGSVGASDTITTISSNRETPMQQQIPARVELLDLNLPALDDGSEDGNLNNLGGNSADSHGASSTKTHSKMSPPKQELLLYISNTHLSKDNEADSKTGMKIGFGRGCDSDLPVRAQTWLQL